MTQQLIIEQQGRLGIIRLNRVESLNALSIEMIQGIHQQVLAWQHVPQVQAILISSNSPKAFSAGGDVRYIYDGYHAGQQQHLNYFADEYAMLNDLSRSKNLPMVKIGSRNLPSSKTLILNPVNPTQGTMEMLKELAGVPSLGV